MYSLTTICLHPLRGVDLCLFTTYQQLDTVARSYNVPSRPFRPWCPPATGLPNPLPPQCPDVLQHFDSDPPSSAQGINLLKIDSLLMVSGVTSAYINIKLVGIVPGLI
ncbi:hypothetical protein PGTUg99_004521 [Puccinia graminis f. sp. tritici]|uniref:Uncharacterized protein n=1 Tax=Puccinia graminis f. sp. tritici TaxID=56615 RepID=A0A5B0RKL1_PUCGR|nr:hypothetical protein PGTUg99_004521 [Puccinia graminis f. sp. tritici]